jgi:signal transduction histidine kinase
MRSAVSKAMLARRTLPGDSGALEMKSSEALNQKIQEQMFATRGDIYASIIHDINGPLTAISGFVQIMSDRLRDPAEVKLQDVTFVKDRLEKVSHQVTNCIEISRRYLSFLRGKSEVPVPISVNQILSDLEHLLVANPSISHHRFTMGTLPVDMAVRVNGTDMIQILLNLVVNALQCSPQPHQVEMVASALSQPLDLLSFKDGPQDRFLNIENFDNTPPLLAVAVRDNGPGIPEQLLPKIFQPYFTTKSQAVSTGLGLSIVQRLIKEAHSALHLHTRVGEGTIFTVYFPSAHLSQAPGR